MKLSKFKEFLKENHKMSVEMYDEMSEEPPEEEMSSTELAQILTKTLGRRFRSSGWNTGTRGSGIIAITDNDLENAKEQAIEIIEHWLKNQNLPYKMKPGKMSDSTIVRYKSNIISVVETDVGFKVLVN